MTSAPETRPAPRIPAGVPGHVATGENPLPLVVVEGESGSGRSWMCAEFTGDPRVGQAYWFDFGEASGDPYGKVPGAGEFVVIDHDGTYAELLRIIELLRVEGQRVLDAGGPPIVVVIDNATDLWVGMQDWTHKRARNSNNNRKILAADPDAEIDVGHSYWNPTNARWKRMMKILKGFPGIVIIIANGDEVTEFDDGGRATRNKVWRVESQKTLTRDSRVWLRLFRDSKPQLIKARSIEGGIEPGQDAARRLDRKPNLIGWLLFDHLGFSPSARAANVVNFDGGELMDDEVTVDPRALFVEIKEQIETATANELPALYERCRVAQERKWLPRPALNELSAAFRARQGELAQDAQAERDMEAAADRAAAAGDDGQDGTSAAGRPGEAVAEQAAAGMPA